MPEFGPEHPLTYRQEVVRPLFAKIQSRESGAVIGVASMGKSRLLQFLLRNDVRAHYLKSAADTTLLLWVDCNRMVDFTAWGLYELLLTTLVETSGEQPALQALRTSLTKWRKESIISQNSLLAQRYVELAVHFLCKEQGLQICLILDEFDEVYAALPAQALANLRALRDRYKYQVSYLLLLRDHPQYLRNPDECEGFYELVSRTTLGLTTYSETDARRVIEQIAQRRNHELTTITAEVGDELLSLSGRHPGLLVALMDALMTTPPVDTLWLPWALQQPKAREECRKLWCGLRKEERDLLRQVVNGQPTDTKAWAALLHKGVLVQPYSKQSSVFFSPLFQHYVTEQKDSQPELLMIDSTARIVSLKGNRIEGITDKEYTLLAYLYEHLGQICENEELITHLYPGDEAYHISDNTIATLIGRLRKKIEPNWKQPRYLLNVHGRGYKLLEEPDDR